VDDEDITSPKCDINKIRQKMGMVFQSFNLFGHMTVIENIMFSPMELLGESKQEAYEEGMKLLHTVGLEEKALNYPDELSGGQKQRIAIARTLAMNPEIILFDEPTSALDPTMVGEVQSVIRDLSKTGKTLIIVTHEMTFARAISNRVFYMDEGEIYEDGTPDEIFDAPKREKTRRFVRKLKVFEFMVNSHKFDLPGMMGKLQEYSFKNGIAPKLSKRIQLVIEELTEQLLLPRLKNPFIYLLVEYSESEESAVVTVKYNGNPFDALGKADELPVKVIKGIVSDEEYTVSEDPEYPNILRFTVNQSN
jgi:polar amino acid transport system ATP-binding protein